MLHTDCREDVEKLLKSVSSIQITKDDYSKISAIAFRSKLSIQDVMSILEEHKLKSCVKDVVPGVLPDQENINEYMNWEHPPLVKFILGLAMALGGLEPHAWRVPSFLMGVLALCAVVLCTTRVAAARLDPSTAGAIAAIVVAYALFDRSLQAMSSVAMLDIYSSALSMMSLAAALWGRLLASSVLLGLAISSKYTALFMLPAITVLMLLRRAGLRRTLLYTVAIPLLITVVLWSPLIAYLGPERWVQELVSSVEWHLSSRPSGPPATTPLGLLLGCQPFTLHYVDGRPLLVAVCNPAVCLGGLVVAVATLLLVTPVLCVRGLHKDEEALLVLSCAYISIVLGYTAVYLAGNRTLYSFYSVQLSLAATPLLASLVTSAPTLARQVRVYVECLRACYARGAHIPILLASSFLSAASLITFTHTIAEGAGHVQLPYTPMLTPWWDTKLVRIAAATAVLIFMARTVLMYVDRFRALSLPRLACYSLIFASAGTATALWHDNALALAVLPICLMGVKGFSDGLVLGMVSPSPIYALLTYRAKSFALCATGFLAGYAARVALSYMLAGQTEWLQQPNSVLLVLICLCSILSAYSLARFATLAQRIVPFLVLALEPRSLHILALVPPDTILPASCVALLELVLLLLSRSSPWTLSAVSLASLVLSITMLVGAKHGEKCYSQYARSRAQGQA